MNTTTITIDNDTITAHITNYDHSDRAMYTISSDDYLGGTVMVQPARLGMHPDHGVMVTFDHVDLGDWAVHGSVTCTGPDMQPGPAAYSSQYPIGQVRKDDPDMADYLSDLVSTIADHYASTYQGHGLR